jgi:hypothetical protein
MKHSWQWVGAIDFVFQVDAAAVTDLSQLLENPNHRHHAFPDIALAVFVVVLLQILEVQVEEPRAGMRNFRYQVRAGSHGVSDIQT